MIELIHYPALTKYKELFHFSTTRLGGVSKDEFASLNLGLFSEDHPTNIQTNFSRIAEKTGIDSSRLHLPFQTHDDKVAIIDDTFLKQTKEQQTNALYGVDALITAIPNQCIAVTTADCTPIFIYDPKQKVVAAIHAGWKSTLKLIIQRTIDEMERLFKSNTDDMTVVLGASIAADSYPVGAELIPLFKESGFNTESIFYFNEGKWHLDVRKANKEVLIKAGVPKSNIEISEHCTYKEGQLFFSARRQGIRSGRMIHGIMMFE